MASLQQVGGGLFLFPALFFFMPGFLLFLLGAGKFVLKKVIFFRIIRNLHRSAAYKMMYELLIVNEKQDGF